MNSKQFIITWKYYWLILLIYNFVIPIKYLLFMGFVYGYGMAGGLSLLRDYPIAFFLNPLILFFIIRYSVEFIFKSNFLRKSS